MLIFLGWSGDESKEVALVLKGWLKMVCNTFDPWISDDVDKGVRWSPAIAAKLRESQAGVFVLTPNNLPARWLHFEAGAISNVPDARVCTLLRRLKPAAIERPLGDFQHTQDGDRDDMLRLVKTLWAKVPAGSSGLSEKQLEQSFDAWWPKLIEALAKIPPDSGAPPPAPNLGEMMEQVLALVRELVEGNRERTASQQRQLDGVVKVKREREALARGLSVLVDSASLEELMIKLAAPMAEAERVAGTLRAPAEEAIRAAEKLAAPMAEAERVVAEMAAPAAAAIRAAEEMRAPLKAAKALKQAGVKNTEPSNED
jgi:hypothetical protein